jgi:hypothetical protein
MACWAYGIAYVACFTRPENNRVKDKLDYHHIRRQKMKTIQIGVRGTVLALAMASIGTVAYA